MSAECTGWVYRYSPAKGAALLVHLAVADSANDQHGYELWMRQHWLADKARVSRRAVGDALAWLVDNGLLELLEAGKDAGKANRYRFLMPALEATWEPKGVQSVRTPLAESADPGAQGVRRGVRTEVAHNPRVNSTEKPSEQAPAPAATSADDRQARLAAAAKIIGERAGQRPGVERPGAMANSVARGVMRYRHDEAYKLLAADPWLTAHDLAERLEPANPTPAPGRQYVGPLPVEVVLSDEEPRWAEGAAEARAIRSELGWDRPSSRIEPTPEMVALHGRAMATGMANLTANDIDDDNA